MEHTIKPRRGCKNSTIIQVTVSLDLKYRMSKTANRKELPLSRLITSVMADYLEGEDRKQAA